MRNFKTKMVTLYQNNKKITVMILFCILISIISLGSYVNQAYEIEQIKKELLQVETLKPKGTQKELLHYKEKIDESNKKIEVLESAKKEIEKELKKNIDLLKCTKSQVNRIIDGKETKEDYCDQVPEVRKTIEKNHIVDVNKKVHKYYFTSYDLGDPNQNDSTPCVGASGKNLCHLHEQGINTLALVNLKRKEMGIKFGDKVELKGGPCEGIYQVEDEMNWRFRQPTPVYKPGTKWEIRGDIARYKHKLNCGGAYTIEKVS